MSLVGEFGNKEWEDEIRLLGVDEYDKIIVAVCKDKIVGSMAYKKVDENVAELKRIYIYKDFRGMGIAKDLYNKILETTKSQNYKKLMVETWENFQSGISFYYKNNFELVLKDDKRYVFMLDLN